MFVTMVFHHPAAESRASFEEFMTRLEDHMSGTEGLESIESYHDLARGNLVALARWWSADHAQAGVARLMSFGGRDPHWTVRDDEVFQLQTITDKERVIASGALHPVAHFEIVSGNAPRLQKFYADLFGWTITTDDDGYGLVDTGGVDAAVTGGIGPSMAVGDTGVKIYVRTHDLEATLAEAKSLGSAVYLDPMELPGGYGRIAVVSDPDGNPVGLWA